MLPADARSISAHFPEYKQKFGNPANISNNYPERNRNSPDNGLCVPDNRNRNRVSAMLRKTVTTLTLAVATLTALCSCNFNNSGPNGTSNVNPPTVRSDILAPATEQKQTTASPTAQTIEADKVLAHDLVAAVDESALNYLFAALVNVGQGLKMTIKGENGQDLVQAGKNGVQTGLSNGSLIRIAAGQTVRVHKIANIPDIPKEEGACVSNITYQGKDYLIFVFAYTFK